MQKLFDFSKAQMQVPEDDERLMKILKIVKEYDYIFEVVDDEFQDHWNFTEYEYDFKEEGLGIVELRQRITRTHSTRAIRIGLNIAFSRQPCHWHIIIRLGNLNGY